MHCCALSKPCSLLTAALTLPTTELAAVKGMTTITLTWVPEIVSEVQEEECATSSYIPCIIYRKFAAGQLHIPVILGRFDGMPQHVLQSSVKARSLFVLLQVRCSGHTLISFLAAHTL